MARRRTAPLCDEREREMRLALRELGERQRARLSAPPPPLRRRAMHHLTSSASCRRSSLSFCIGLACMLGYWGLTQLLLGPGASLALAPAAGLEAADLSSTADLSSRDRAPPTSRTYRAPPPSHAAEEGVPRPP